MVETEPAPAVQEAVIEAESGVRTRSVGATGKPTGVIETSADLAPSPAPPNVLN